MPLSRQTHAISDKVGVLHIHLCKHIPVASKLDEYYFMKTDISHALVGILAKYTQIPTYMPRCGGSIGLHIDIYT